MIQPHAKTLVQQVGRLLDHDTTYDNEKIWMIAQSKNDPGLQQAIKGLSTADIHVIARITQSDQVRIKSLPELTKLSQPTISRTITKLEQRNLLEKYRTVKNDKGILVRLTPTGKAIATIHSQLDAEIERQVAELLAPYPQEEITDFITLIGKLAAIDVPYQN
ncbi:MarR family winged helix-turn-helix transcriptional regulator [Secundilactobacillus paracollinoides]|uniref:MarR family winged helix-turn-helix transcriptional regulator n=1 Tax=Secundilactobacillus paracollinoides TaxID=240427 RepID=UPI0006EE960C|nr:MarR family transcriptional regulator [Secundilactobacillus paracollinoides]KRL79673.1 hypothetical protein FC17_GL000267 [Secundilactobacillus paracollinoides DSM 15502 = JCM 11969]